ncbi:hypothetical protein ACX8XP_03875 [Calditrichota bacterium LG25]
MLRTFLFIIILYELTFAQISYEPGVILLKVKNPKVVKIENNMATNSVELNKIFKEHKIINSQELPYLSSLTEGWYRIEFSRNSNLKEIKS